jgi:heme O synthase-like polyprenyltransferase
MIGTALSVSSMAAYHMFAPFTWIVSNSVWLSYLLIYLPMKQKSEQNTLVGAIVGALPPFIGTFAQIGTLLDPCTLMLSAYIFSWQFPHFYGILYEHKDDYKKAGFVMTSNNDPEGDKKAHKQILACTIFNTAIPFVMTASGYLNGWVLLPFIVSQYKAF